METFIAFLICALKGATAINVALGKRSTLCESVYLTSKLFDGDIYASHEIYFVMKYCKGRTPSITVSLDDLYYVHYVIIYAGTTPRRHPPPKDHIKEPLDYFKVSLIKDEQEFVCSRFEKSFKSTDPGEGLRVNCMTTNISVSMVRLVLETSADFRIAEIEVHTLASGFPDEPVIFYRGCFRNISSKVVSPFDSFDNCWKKCHEEQYALTGIKNGKECHCATDYEFSDELVEKRCDEVCPNPERHCGGNESYSVYIVNAHLPYHHGCSYGFVFPLTKTKYHPNVSFCLDYCDLFSIFGLMGETCVCGEEVLDVVPDIFRCNFSCFGFDDDICGGEEFYSIYGTCGRQDHEFLSCKKLFQCEDVPNKYGICTTGCKPGFIGDYCIEKDATVSLIDGKTSVLLIILFIFFVVMALTIGMIPIVHMKLYMKK